MRPLYQLLFLSSFREANTSSPYESTRDLPSGTLLREKGCTKQSKGSNEILTRKLSNASRQFQFEERGEDLRGAELRLKLLQDFIHL